MTGPLVDEVMVAAGCNCALAEERAGHKLQALRTMRRLNARVRSGGTTASNRPSTQTLLRNIHTIQTVPVAITSELLRMRNRPPPTTIASPPSIPVKVRCPERERAPGGLTREVERPYGEVVVRRACRRAICGR
jgi:hypothetical protein